MKKLIIAAAIVCAAVVSQAAAVGWSCAGLGNFNGDAYNVFIIGQNGVTSVAQITGLLDAGSDISSYVFGEGKVASGSATVASGSSGKTIGAGTWTEFVVLFDSATPVAGTSQYCLLSGKANQTKEVGATTADVTFGFGNGSSVANNTDNWHKYGTGGSVPEPTSAMLLLLGVAGLALKRKVA